MGTCSVLTLPAFFPDKKRLLTVAGGQARRAAEGGRGSLREEGLERGKSGNSRKPRLAQRPYAVQCYLL